MKSTTTQEPKMNFAPRINRPDDQSMESMLDQYTTYDPSTRRWTIYDNHGAVVKVTSNRRLAESYAEAAYGEFARSES